MPGRLHLAVAPGTAMHKPDLQPAGRFSSRKLSCGLFGHGVHPSPRNQMPIDVFCDSVDTSQETHGLFYMYFRVRSEKCQER